MMPKHMGRKDYIGDIADSICALAVREGGGSDLGTNRAKGLTVFALRGFWEFKPRIATGVYGSGMYEARLHISHNGKHLLWNLGLRCPITQRIAKCASLGLRGSMSMEFAGKDTLLLADPPPWAEANFMNYRMSDVKTSKRASEPHTISALGRSAKLQSMYFAAFHEDAHLEERNSTTQRRVDLHEDRPAAFSVDFMVDTWNRVVSDYNGS